MTICRECGKVSPSGSLFCEGCGKSFNARLCPAKHESSPEASFCPICGSDDLSDATKGFRFMFASRAVTIIVLVIALAIALPFLPSITGAIFHALTWIVSILFGSALSSFWQFLTGWLLVWVLVWILIRICLGSESKILRAFEEVSAKLAKLLFGSVIWLCRVTLKALFHREEKP